MQIFQPSNYGIVFEELMDDIRPLAINSGTPNFAVHTQLKRLTVETAFVDKQISDPQAALGCLSGIWLWHNFLDQSHTISQDLHNNTGSFWHGIMHRRETDFSNAAYWFRKVGDHSVFSDLAEQATQRCSEVGSYGLVSSGRWDPFRFIDLCSEANAANPPLLKLCQQITRIEWQLLFDYCFHQATQQRA